MESDPIDYPIDYLVGSFGRGGGLTDGLVKRIVDAVVFSWFLLMPVRLVQLSTRKGTTRNA